MQINMESEADVNLIKSYEHGKIRVNQTSYSGNIIVASDSLVTEWEIDTPSSLTEQDFQKMASFQPMIVLLGTGDTQVFPEPSLLTPLIERQIGMEVMTTRNACYTYNVLVHEGRRVLAALFV